MSQTIQSDPRAMVESVARRLAPDAAEDFRLLMNEIVLGNLTALSPGGNLIKPGGPKAGSSAPPAGVTHSVVGANAAYTVAITNPPGHQSTPIYHEVSYSPVKSFTKNVTTRPPTTDTNIIIPAPGVNAFFRLRHSFDKKTWTAYQPSSLTSIDAGLVESSAISSGAAFNQTNFAVINSQNNGGGGATVTINGTGGIFSPYTAVKGGVQSLRPSATIVGAQIGPQQFVGWDGGQFRLVSTLAGVFPDNLEPVGHIVIGSGIPGGGGATGGNGGRLTAV